MSETTDNTVTAALTFKVPQKIDWSVQSNDRSWTGNELSGLRDCLAQEARDKSVTLSLSLIFELTGNKGTVGRHRGYPGGMPSELDGGFIRQAEEFPAFQFRRRTYMQTRMGKLIIPLRSRF